MIVLNPSFVMMPAASALTNASFPAIVRTTGQEVTPNVLVNVVQPGMSPSQYTRNKMG